jgi:hypothetical protein
MMLILDLAVMADTDPEARAVLGDAVLESGWFSPHVMPLLNPQQYRRATDRKQRRAHFALAAGSKRTRTVSRAWCRAVLAVLLFEDWAGKAERNDPTLETGWPYSWTVASRCYYKPDYASIVRSLYPQSSIPESLSEGAFEGRIGGYGNLAHSNNPLFGLTRTRDPVRLAGQRLDASYDPAEAILRAADIISKR